MLAQIPEDSVAGVDAANLLGDKYINITKGKSPIAIKDGGTLKSLEWQDIPELMSRAGDMLGSFQVDREALRRDARRYRGRTRQHRQVHQGRTALQPVDGHGRRN